MNMKKINILTLMLMLTVSVAFGQTFNYSLNYGSIKFGNSATGQHQFNGLATFVNGINVPLRSLSDSTDNAASTKFVKQLVQGLGSPLIFNNGLTESGGVVGLGGDAVWEFPNEVFIGNSYTGGTGGGFGASVSSVSLTFNKEGVGFNGIFGSEEALVLIDNLNNKGAQYASDYSANFTARSLVDKGYVDGAIGNETLQSVTDRGKTTTESISASSFISNNAFSDISQQGTYISWNDGGKSGGSVIANNRGGGSGGIYFQDYFGGVRTDLGSFSTIGAFKVNGLAGAGDRPVVADANGTLKVGHINKRFIELATDEDLNLWEGYDVVVLSGKAIILQGGDNGLTGIPSELAGNTFIVRNKSGADITYSGVSDGNTGFNDTTSTYNGAVLGTFTIPNNGSIKVVVGLDSNYIITSL